MRVLAVVTLLILTFIAGYAHGQGDGFKAGKFRECKDWVAGRNEEGTDGFLNGMFECAFQYNNGERQC